MRIEKISFKVEGPCDGAVVYLECNKIFIAQQEDLIMLDERAATNVIKALSRVLEEIAMEQEEERLKQAWWTQQDQDAEFIDGETNEITQ